MIGMAAKDSEETSAQGARKRRHSLRQAFWTKALEELRARNVSRFDNISSSNDHWLGCATGVSGCAFNLIFSKNEARVELYLQRSVAAENKWIFDRLERERQELEEGFGDVLTWQRLDDKKASRICYSHPFDGFNAENWPEMIEWLCRNIVRLDAAFSEPLARLNQQMKSRSDMPVSDRNVPQSPSAP